MWRIISASVVGKGHLNLDVPIPCQDNQNWKKLSEKWCIAVVADGAGSYENSHLGSAFVVEELINILEPRLLDKEWFENEGVPNEEEWREFALCGLEDVRDNLEEYAKTNEIDFHSLGCTVILCVFSSDCLLSAHIGDGRACYKNDKQEWKPAISPFKGEEAGSTVFITTEACWKNKEICIETRVVEEKIESACLLTDGMEAYSYLCYTKDENGMYSDPNEPFESFFNYNITVIDKMLKDGKTDEQISESWERYLSNSNLLSNEYDDKTMLIALKLTTT